MYPCREGTSPPHGELAGHHSFVWSFKKKKLEQKIKNPVTTVETDGTKCKNVSTQSYHRLCLCSFPVLLVQLRGRFRAVAGPLIML